jgi:hypothetical protein
MMQLCASAARLLGGRPILLLGIEPNTHAGHCHLGSSWHLSRYKTWINARPVLRAPYAVFDQSSLMLPNAGRHRPGLRRSWRSATRRSAVCVAKRSRPASNATTIRLIREPVLVARHRNSNRSTASGSGRSFFNGCRLRLGTRPPTSQLPLLSSTTAIKVLAWSKATRDRLKSSRFMGRSIGCQTATMVPHPRRRPHSIFCRPAAEAVWGISDPKAISGGVRRLAAICAIHGP